MNIQFWSKDPAILWNKDYLDEIWPITNMSFETQLNAISRLVIYLSIFGFLTTLNVFYLISGILTLLIIYIIYKYRNNPILHNTLEGFSKNNQLEWKPLVSSISGKTQPLDKFLNKSFYNSTSNNPFGNVLLTEINDNPNRKSAPPSFNPDVSRDIINSSKKMVQEQNKGIKTTDKKLFGDLWDNFELDLCLRNFYTTANSKVPNDQGAYADYLYGSMPSCKDGNAFECVKDNSRYILI
jgi:hypothetical protein